MMELNTGLYEKAVAEQAGYRAWLLVQPPADILLHAAEYAVREDILMELEALELPADKTRALLASPDTMSDIYKTFSKMSDTGHMDVIRECIEDRADTLIKSGILTQPGPERQEAVYLVDRAALLHLKEDPDGNFEYAVFDRQTKENTDFGWIVEADVLDGIDPIHGPLASARDAAVKAAGLDGIEVAQVGLTSLKLFPKSDIYRRAVREPDTLPADDIRFINSNYDEQFRIPDGGTIQVEFPDRTFSARCKYLDDYHTCIGSEVYHICQFAEVLERNGGVCRPEPVLEAEQAAWKIGWNAYLAVECGEGHWDYHLYDEKFNETKSGELEVAGCSIHEVRDRILSENKLGSRSMTPAGHGILMEKAAAREQEKGRQQPAKPSIKAQLAAKPVPGGQPAVKPKDREVR